MADRPNLFREAALAHTVQPKLGRVIQATPVSYRTTSLLLGLLVVGIVSGLSTGQFARKESVDGLITTKRATTHVHVRQARGELVALHVTAGQRVAEGQLLAKIELRSHDGNGRAVHHELRTSLEAQISALAAQHGAARSLHQQRLAQMSSRGERLEVEQQQVQRAHQLQTQRLAEANQRFTTVEQLMRQGVITKDKVSEVRSELLFEQAQLNEIEIQLTRLAAERSGNRQERQMLPFQFEQELADLAQSRARLQQQYTQLQSEHAYQLMAPTAGEIALIEAKVGETVGNRDRLLSIVPSPATLEAQLYIPSRAAGFVAAGQTVRLRLDAFPYQEFGTHTGTVSRVSGIPSRQTGQSEPTYTATIRLGAQQFRAYGQPVALQPGMSLGADIILEQRSIIDWMLAPLYRLRGRTH